MSKALATKNVAAVLLALGLAFGFAFAFAQPAKADTLSDLQTQVQALLAQIAALQGTGTATAGSTSGACFTFTQDLHKGSSGQQVQWLQEFLNGHGAQIAASGAGSPGNETMYYGGLTAAAVTKFQEAYATQILTPVGLTSGTGYWGSSSRAEANALCAGASTGTGTGTGTTPTGTGVVVTAGTQPQNTLAPMNASRVPFTTFTLTNNSGAAVTINGITIQRTGLANDDAFAGVILVDSNGIQYGNSQTFNSNHQATVGGTFTLNAGQSMTYTVAGNMETSVLGNAGQVASISVTAVNTTVPVTGSLPITGAQQTINESLTIGTASMSSSSYDPNGGTDQSIGTTGVIFSGVRITAQGEDQKLYSIAWNQTGSVGSGDLSNLVTVVNGTSYPMTIDSSGKYYTATFPGGILITKGNSVDAYVKGDITGSSAAGRSVEFDIYRASDIYLVGQTYGYGVTPTPATTGAKLSADSNGHHGSVFVQNNGSPFFEGSLFGITAGQLSTLSNASTVPPQNIGVNVSSQTLGGFTTNFTGEGVTVQSLKFTVASSSGATQLQNVTLVDSNGAVVAGPVDENMSTNPGTITFNSSVTFPTGSQTYTLEGTVASPAVAGANDGTTYTLSTDLSNWGSATGQNSGSYVSLSGSVTMSQMTVKTSTLTISASASPANQTITGNGSSMTIGNIVFDASNSGEDIRLNSLPVVINATDTTAVKANIGNCQLWNGSTVLNNTAVGSSQWVAETNLTSSLFSAAHKGLEANFVFSTPLTIPKGTTVTVSLNCTVGNGIPNDESFAAGVDSAYTLTAAGATSGGTFTVTPSTTNSGVMTIGTGSLEISATSPSYTQVAGGTTGVTLGSFTLQPQSGSVNLQEIGLKLDSHYASTSDLTNGVVTLWNGSTQVGTVNFNGKTAASDGFYYASTTLSTSLAQSSATTYTIKGDVAQVGTNESGVSNHEILVGLSNAKGTSGSSVVYSGHGTMPGHGSGIAIFKAFPSITQQSLSSSGVSDGQLIEFSVTAPSSGPVNLNQFVFTFASSTHVTLTTPNLYAYTSSNLTGAANGTTNGVAGSTTYSNNAGQTATTTMSTPLQIPAGATWYFLLKAQGVQYGGTNTTYSITTTLQGDGADLSPNLKTATSLDAGSHVIWSPNSTTINAGTGDVEWTNGYGINGLPSFGISQTRSN